jgi:sugar (pentulose or hexulose) kinase
MTADILGINCVASNRKNASAFGAALMAGISTGEMTWDCAERAAMRDVSVYRANPGHYEQFYNEYINASCHSKI